MYNDEKESGNTMITANALDVYYDKFHVLKNISMTAERNEITLLVGPNGHGKSTLLKTICGLLKPKNGSIFLDGIDISMLPSDKVVQKGVTYIAEDRHLFPHMTILQNLKLGAFNKNARSDAKKNLDLVFTLFPRLKERASQLAATLSGGEARMLAIGRGLMSNAQFLVIDEPSMGLSPLFRKEVLRVIKEIMAEGKTILLVDQCVSEVLEISNTLYLMEEGKIVFSGDIDEAKANNKVKEVFFGC